MTDAQRNIRDAVRAFLLCATLDQMKEELRISEEAGDTFRADCIRALIAEES